MSFSLTKFFLKILVTEMLRRSSFLFHNHKLFISKVNHVKISSQKYDLATSQISFENKDEIKKENILNKVIAASNEIIGFNEIDKLYKAVSSLQVRILRRW